jgi:hypothetical protein
MAEPEFTEPRGCRLTQSEDGKRLYVHLIEYPYKFLEMKGMAGKLNMHSFCMTAVKYYSRKRKQAFQRAAGQKRMICLSLNSPTLNRPLSFLLLNCF